MRISKIHGLVALWVFVSSARLVSQTPLPPGAVSLVNQDKYGGRVAFCAGTGEPDVRQGAKTIRSTAVWAGEPSNLHRVEAGPGACDPAWSPDGRRLAVTAAQGLWVFPADSAEGDLRVASKIPLGVSTEFSYRLFSQPRWSPDGVLVAVLVTNGGTSWVEVFEVNSGRLFYTSPPENYSFSWNNARELKLGNIEIHLPRR
jgi:dipeptidyl aminopeptidase/acylaminoacyl peptidase